MGNAAVARQLAQAAEHYNLGRSYSAGALCADILAAEPGHLPALHLASVIAFAGDRMADGRDLLNRLFRLDPDYGPAFATLGDALAVSGQHDAAVAVFQRAIKRRPFEAGLHAKHGVSLAARSRFVEAEAAYRCALALDPDLIQARFNLAVALAGQRRVVEAERIYRDVIAREPQHRGAWVNLGNLLADRNEPEEAVIAYRWALAPDAQDHGSRRSAQDATVVTALANLAASLCELGRLDEATEACRRALALDPNHAPTNTNLGIILDAQGDLDGAVDAHRRAVAADPTCVKGHVNLAAALRRIGALDEAIEACRRALALDPDHAPAHTDLGIILDAKGDFEGAVVAHRRAVAADPTHARAHANLAVALRTTGALDEALATTHRAVALDPDDPMVRFNHAHALLMNGHLTHGFEEFRWGAKCRNWAEGYPAFAEPEWQGESFVGRTLLLYAEAGLGDTLQFVRYLPMAAKRGGSIVLQVQAPLVPLLRANCADPTITVIALGDPRPRFDLQSPLMGLPRLFGTTLDTIPADVPYLHPDSAKLAQWRSILGNESLLKVGVVWAGNPRHKGDRLRSLAAETLLPRLVMPAVRLHSLQKTPRAADVTTLAKLADDIVDLAPALGDFSDTTAAVAALDLVITVDTSVAHLAGALGRPVWMLLPHALDWRWLRDREDTPWYPSMRLFRQRTPLVWDDVITRATTELARLAHGEHDLLRPLSRARRIATPTGIFLNSAVLSSA
jgi:tetratricopeptide (TPR) repeat protein